MNTTMTFWIAKDDEEVWKKHLIKNYLFRLRAFYAIPEKNPHESPIYKVSHKWILVIDFDYPEPKK